MYYHTWMILRGKRMLNPDDGGGEGSNPTGGEQPGQGNPITLDDALKDKAVQAEFDRRMQKGIETALNNAHAKWEEEAHARETEAAKLAKMTAEQRQEHERQQREAELEKRERDLQFREMRAQALETLAEKQLPRELADCLDYASAEKCQASVENVEKAFRAAVQSGVEERLRGKKEPETPGSTDAQMAAMRAAMGLK